MGAGTVDEHRLGQVIEKSYEAVLRPELWPSVFQAFAEASSAAGLICFHLGAEDNKSLFMCSRSLEEAVDVYVREGWFRRNPRLERAPRVSSTERLITDNDVHSEEYLLEPADREWRHDFLMKQGLGWFAGTDFFFNGGNDRVGISIERSGQHDRFQNSELAVMHRALAHIRRAMTFAPSLDDSAAQGLLSGFEASGRPAGLLDAAGRVILLNARAEAIMGSIVRVRDGYLTVDSPQVHKRLCRFIASLVRPGPRCDDDPLQSVTLPRPNDYPIIVRGAPIAPLGVELFKYAKAFITFTLVGGNTTRLEDGILRDAFGLTPAETRVALSIADGHDCNDIAKAHGLSLTTVRTHIKAIFTKTGTRRQTSLALLIAGMSRSS